MTGKVLAGLIVMLVSVAIFAGCIEREPSVEELRISNIVFCSEEPEGYMNYTEQPEATYKPGDTVWIYMNFKGVKYNPNLDGTKEMWITEHLTLKAPNGDILLSKEVINEHKNFPEELDPNKLFFANRVTTTPQLVEGKYIVEMVATDKLADKTATASSSFTLSR